MLIPHNQWLLSEDTRRKEANTKNKYKLLADKGNKMAEKEFSASSRLLSVWRCVNQSLSAHARNIRSHTCPLTI